MSTKPETLFYKQIFRELKQVFWTRIENRHGGGIPDLYGVYGGFSFWLECKTIIKQNRINISPLQISWNYNHALKGGRCFIIATPLEQTTLNIYGGIQAQDIANNIHEPLIVFHKPFDWREVITFLTQN